MLVNCRMRMLCRIHDDRHSTADDLVPTVELDVITLLVGQLDDFTLASKLASSLSLGHLLGLVDERCPLLLKRKGLERIGRRIDRPELGKIVEQGNGFDRIRELEAIDDSHLDLVVFRLLVQGNLDRGVGLEPSLESSDMDARARKPLHHTLDSSDITMNLDGHDAVTGSDVHVAMQARSLSNHTLDLLQGILDGYPNQPSCRHRERFLLLLMTQFTSPKDCTLSYVCSLRGTAHKLAQAQR